MFERNESFEDSETSTDFEATETSFGEAGVLETAHDLPPHLWDAVRSAVRNTRSLPPPAFYDTGYWRKEREAIARLAVCEAVQQYQDRGCVSLDYFAQRCAEQAIYREWRRLCRQGAHEQQWPEEKPTGEYAELEDPQAQEFSASHSVF